jgi:hypothetical protein
MSLGIFATSCVTAPRPSAPSREQREKSVAIDLRRTPQIEFWDLLLDQGFPFLFWSLAESSSSF